MDEKLKVGDQAPSGTVLDGQGQVVSLESLWSDGPIMLTFLRHFG